MGRKGKEGGIFRRGAVACGDRFRNLSVAARFTVGYIVLGLLWIHVEHDLVPGEDYFFKDTLFVLSSALALYWIVGKGIARIRSSEAQLRKNEELSARILETTANGIFVVDREGTITFANRAGGTMFGMSPDRIVGLKYDDASLEVTTLAGDPFPPDQRPFPRVMATGEPVYDIEFAARRPDGVRLVLSFNAAPLRDSGGEIRGAVVTATDITERQRAHDLDLRKFSMAVEQSPIGVAITDRNGRVEYVNPYFTRMTGFSLAEIMATTDLCPALQTTPEASEPIRRAIGQGTGWTGAFQSRRRNGEIYWESASLSPIRDDDGRFTNFLWLREDITEHRKTLGALRESEERFRRMFEQNEEPVILFRSGSATVLDANPAALALYGYSLEELVAGGPSLFVSPGEAEAFRRQVEEITEDRVFNVERTTHVRRDGQPIIVSARGKCMCLPGGTVSYCSFRDITERIRLEEEAKVRQAQLIHANRIASLGMLVSGVAHEINNPNNLVMFNAPILRNAWRDAVAELDRSAESADFPMGGLPYSEMRDAVPALLDGIEEASRRIKAIVENLKNFGAQDRSALTAPVDANALTRIAVSILQFEISRRTRRFEVSYAEGLPMVQGSPQQLEQVVLNLVMNSLQALKDPSCAVRVVTAMNAATGCVEIRVEDEGVGIPEDAIRKIGKPFYTTKTDSGGLGLGLSICSSIVKSHGGTLGFRSKFGVGTTVIVSLPVAQDPSARRKDPEAGVS